MDSIGSKIRNLRKGMGLSQDALSVKLSVSRQTISKWESNAIVPPFDGVKALSELFGVPTDYFTQEEQITEQIAEEITEEDEPKMAWSERTDEQVLELLMQQYANRRNWGRLILAIIFSVGFVISLFFTVVTGIIVLPEVEGYIYVTTGGFAKTHFYLCLMVDILSLAYATYLWIRFFKMRNKTWIL